MYNRTWFGQWNRFHSTTSQYLTAKKYLLTTYSFHDIHANTSLGFISRQRQCKKKFFPYTFRLFCGCLFVNFVFIQNQDRVKLRDVYKRPILKSQKIYNTEKCLQYLRDKGTPVSAYEWRRKYLSIQVFRYTRDLFFISVLSKLKDASFRQKSELETNELLDYFWEKYGIHSRNLFWTKFGYQPSRCCLHAGLNQRPFVLKWRIEGSV